MPDCVSGPIVEHLYLDTLKDNPLFDTLHLQSPLSWRLILQRIGMVRAGQDSFLGHYPSPVSSS